MLGDRRREVVAVLAALCVHLACLPVDRWSIQTQPQPGPKDFDLRADGVDLNGFMLNPAWQSQLSASPKLASSDACRPDLKTAFSERTCTSQHVRFDLAKMPTLAICGLSSPFAGHVNWAPATVTGTARWLTWAAPFDNDVNFYFVPDDGIGGLTAGNETIEGTTTPYIELEYTSDETLGAFSTPWQTGLWERIVAWSESTQSDAAIRAWLNPDAPDDAQRAVVVGLFGLDCEHSCKSEVHPVFALALEVNKTLTTSTWAVFARNWGTEGFCAHRLHYLDLPGRALRLSLPGPGAPGAHTLKSATFAQYATTYPDETPAPLVESNEADGSAVLTVVLPSPDAHPLSEILVTLAWDPAAKKLPILNRPRLARPSVQVEPVKGLRAERVLRSAVPPGWPQARPPVRVTKTTPRALEPLRTIEPFARTRKLQAPGRVPAVKKPDTGKWLEARKQSQRELLRRLCVERQQTLPGLTAEQSRRVCAQVLR